LYERYADISGIRTSSFMRPLTNVSLDARPWAFPADIAILQFLSREAPGFSVVTDHGIHWRGVQALEGARVVVTGTHPEYWSFEMLDAMEAFLAKGGRLIYSGGNGFYWVTSLSKHWPGAVELRRAEDGTRAWIEEPGEYYSEFDGRLGGMWRRNGRAPNKLVGIGFAAQGFSKSTFYRRKPAADDPRAAFIFKGVPETIIGDFGAIGGGAAGEEIDRYDRSLGSPAHGLVLASSEDHGPDMLRVKEEFYSTKPLVADPYVRADMVFFETPAGGAVFSTGSIAWGGALGHDGYENNVARIFGNVVKRFADPTPFAFPDAESQVSSMQGRL
jgi:N,N-dimethylformamidase